MNLKGKKINFLGDSITQGCGASSETEKGYVAVMGRLLDLSAARNYGIGGTRIARQHTPSENPLFDRDFCSRVEEMDPDADVVVVFGGTNDHGHGDAPFGSPGDRTEATFCGACHVLCRKLSERFPHAKIVILTPLHRFEEKLRKGDSLSTLEDYVNAIQTTAAQYNIPVLDLFRTSVLRIDDPAIAAKYAPDGLHPNDEGHEILAREIAEYLQGL